MSTNNPQSNQTPSLEKRVFELLEASFMNGNLDDSGNPVKLTEPRIRRALSLEPTDSHRLWKTLERLCGGSQSEFDDDVSPTVRQFDDPFPTNGVFLTYFQLIETDKLLRKRNKARPELSKLLEEKKTASQIAQAEKESAGMTNIIERQPKTVENNFNRESAPPVAAAPEFGTGGFDARIMNAIKAGNHSPFQISRVTGLSISQLAKEIPGMIIDGKLEEKFIDGSNYFLRWEAVKDAPTDSNQVEAIRNQIEDFQIADLQPEPPNEAESASTTAKPVKKVNVLPKKKKAMRKNTKLTVAAIESLPPDVATQSQIAKYLNMSESGVSSSISLRPEIKAAIHKHRAAHPHVRSSAPRHLIKPDAKMIAKIEQWSFEGKTVREIAHLYAPVGSTKTFENYIYCKRVKSAVYQAWQSGRARRARVITQPLANQSSGNQRAVAGEPVEATLVCDSRLNETVERLEDRNKYDREIQSLTQSLAAIAERAAEPAAETAIAVVPQAASAPDDYLARLEHELNDNKLLFRKLAVERQYQAVWGESSPKGPQVWNELEEMAA